MQSEHEDFAMFMGIAADRGIRGRASNERRTSLSGSAGPNASGAAIAFRAAKQPARRDLGRLYCMGVVWQIIVGFRDMVPDTARSRLFVLGGECMSTVLTGNGPRAFFNSGLSATDVPFTEIPVIDFAAMFTADPAARRAVGDAVRDACTKVGFFYVSNHQVPQSVVDRTFAAAHRFFDLPLEDKMAVDIARSPNLRGYTPLLGENTDPTARGDLHEGFDIALDLDDSDPDVRAGVFGYGPNQWPQNLPGFREDLLAYQAAMLAFGLKIFDAFALALDLPEEHFRPLVSKPMAQMRVLFYPSQDGEVDDRQIGIGAHSDYECFTILCTDDTPALQVLNSAGQWIMAPPIPGCFIVNVGDLMARWTNDYFASTVHRAINRSGRKRYSIPFFYGTNSQTLIEVLPTCQGPERPAKYPAMTAGDYIRSRFDDTYAHRKENAEP